MHARTNPLARPARLAALLGVAILAAALSCSVARRSDTPRQSWWSERGPVVPHESFPADCSLCHEGRGWTTIRSDFEFDHASRTGVALEGAHARAESLRCHNDRGPVEMFAARGCAGCHENVHRAQLGGDCESCHSQSDWRPNETVVAHARTRFPLTGAHVVAACWRCHPGAQTGNFARADTSCVGCHRDSLAAAVSPDHLAQGWVDDCERCHVPTQWSGSGFTHATWPLVGRHATALCAQCHAAGVFAGIPSQCVDCHLAEYQGANDPDHVALNISTQCQQCHTPHGWEGADFPHTGIVSGCVNCHMDEYQGTSDPDHVQAGWGTTCEQCHTNTSNWHAANFAHTGVTTGCAACHMNEFQATNDPDHVLAGFGTTCEQCHNSTSNWFDADFDHTGITNGCFSCHQSDYQQASPNHSGFPTTCEQCHTSTSSWSQVNFSHAQFPITSGRHNGISCAECHTTAGNYQAFSCIDCHEHRQSEMNSEHQSVPAYVWESGACYQCHPNGQE